jgi:hypothetical protein
MYLKYLYFVYGARYELLRTYTGNYCQARVFDQTAHHSTVTTSICVRDLLCFFCVCAQFTIVCAHSSVPISLLITMLPVLDVLLQMNAAWKVTWDTDAKINLWRNYITGATALEAPSKAWKCDNKKDRWITKVYAILYTIYYTDTADTQVCIASQCDSAHLGSA